MKCNKIIVCFHVSLVLKLDVLVDNFITYETYTCCLSLALRREFQGCEYKMKIGHQYHTRFQQDGRGNLGINGTEIPFCVALEMHCQCLCLHTQMTNPNTRVVPFATLIRGFFAMNLLREAGVAFAALIYQLLDSASEIISRKHSKTYRNYAVMKFRERTSHPTYDAQ